MPNWKESADETLLPAGLPEYKTGMAFLYGELVDFSTILYLAEKIIAFPWDLFGRHEEIFFSLVMRSFHDTAILLVTRIVSDQSGDSFTLPRFKNRVRTWTHPQLLQQFDQHMKQVRFDKTVESILEKVKELRNNRVAHTSQSFVSGALKLYRPSLAELQKVRDALVPLFNVLAFNVEYNMLPVDYAPNVIRGGPGPHTTDIEDILNAVARNSGLINMPEQHPMRWLALRSTRPAAHVAIVNDYRRRLGLPEA